MNPTSVGEGRAAAIGALIVSLAALLVAAAPAAAASDPISGGETTIVLDPELYKLMNEWGVGLLSMEPQRRDRVAELPIVQGAIDPTTGSARIEHRGRFGFRRGKRRVVFRAPHVETDGGVLTAKLGGKRRVIAFLRGLRDRRDGFRMSLRAKAVLLTQDVAEKLNRKLRVLDDFDARSLPRPTGTGLFGALRWLASSRSVVEPRTVTAIGGSLNLALDPAFVAKLTELNVEVRNFEGASLISASPQTWSFPLLRGAVSPLLATGSVGSETGLRLRQDESAAVMTLSAIAGSLESDSLFADCSVHRPVGAPSLYGTFPIASLSRSGALASTNPAARTISYSGVAASLSAQLADALDDAFAKPKGKLDVFKAGEPLGSFGFDVRTQ